MALRASREQLTAILSGLADAIIVQRPDGRLLYANEAAARLLGFPSAAALLAAPVPELLAHVEVRDEAGRPLPGEHLPGLRALGGERVPPVQLRFRLAGAAEERWWAAAATPVLDERGQVRFAVSFFHDITPQKQAERRLAFLVEAGAHVPASLDEEETLRSVTRLAVQTLADLAIVFLVDEQQRVRRTAVAHRQPARQALAEALERLPPFQPAEESPVWQTLRDGVPRLVRAYSDEFVARLAQNAEHLRLLRELGLTSGLCVPLVARGHTLGALSLFTTESTMRFTESDLAVAEEIGRRAALAVDNARLYAAERRARAEAQAAVRARDEFLSIASHELRNPTAGLKLTAQMLLRWLERGQLGATSAEPGQPGEARLARALRNLGLAADRLAVLLEDLLDVTRLHSGQLQLRRRRSDLAGLIRAAVAHQRRSSPERTIHVELACDPCLLEVDPDRVQQVLEHLLSNAVKFSPGGGTIWVSLSREAEGVLLRVRDEGIGLPPGAAEAIFRPFGRAANARELNVPGMGLGLYICEQIVRSHGGRLWAESPGQDKGAILSLWLPALPEQTGHG